MARYTLDYSVPSPAPRRRPDSSGHWRWPLVLALISLCAGLVAFVDARHVRSENQRLRAHYNALSLQYDSLVSAQLYANRQRALLNQFLKDSTTVTPPLPSLSVDLETP